MPDSILPLDTAEDALDTIGGKGRSLAKLARAGFSVPAGYHVPAGAYRAFLADNGLAAEVPALAVPELRTVGGRAVVSFEAASERIRDLIAGGTMDVEAADAIRRAYAELGGSEPAVAVRSSANAEDLPGLSFAGQQETYLNVYGADAVVQAVQRCWASLWTPQAISYRHQNGIDQASVAMAVVVQAMVPSEVSGILFTANPATGERGEMVVNASFGLGEAVVGGQVTPDTITVDRVTLAAKETLIGAKEQQIVADAGQGVATVAVAEEQRAQASLDEAMLRELASTALAVEGVYDGAPQDIEWAFANGALHILQSRPITNLPVQPVELQWTPTPPAKYLSRRQIVENMPDPICPLFEELYLTEGLESSRPKSLMVGGGPMFVTMNGYAYQRFDWPQFFVDDDEGGGPKAITEADLDAAEFEAMQHQQERQMQAALQAQKTRLRDQADIDIALFRETLSAAERDAFDAFAAEREGAAVSITLPESDNPTFTAFNNTHVNDRQLKEWHEVTRPRLVAVAAKWATLDPASASDETLLAAMRELGIEEGYYWSSNSSHTFGVAKSTDDQFQCFLRETLPEHNFISGQFLSGIPSKAMQANADLFEIARRVRGDEALSFLVLATPAKFLMDALRQRKDAAEVVDAIDAYLAAYGHQGYSMDFVEPTQIEDPSALFATLKAMVGDPDYDPRQQQDRAAAVRLQKTEEITELLDGLPYWQFRFRLWLARRYNHIREEVAFHFGYSWRILRPMAAELGHRLVDAGTFRQPDDTYFLVSEELRRAIAARGRGEALPELGALAAERRELREARKRHHPPGTIPEFASQIKGIAFKETQIRNDESSDTMRGFPVSSGRVTAKASVISGPAEFDRMQPGTILVSPLTTPAWTQLFAHAAGLVTDVGSILAHGSIVAREYGIPAVLGVGNGTVRIRHGQTLTIDGDAGTVVLHDAEATA